MSELRSLLVEPFFDALFSRGPENANLRHHAARFPGLTDHADRVATEARYFGYQVDDDWHNRHLVSLALDRRDNFSRWLRRSITQPSALEVVGEWPEKPFAAIGLHWGTGFPALEHLQRNGREPSFLFLPESGDALSTWPQRIFNRIHEGALSSFGEPIRVGGAIKRINALIDQDRTIVALADAPVTQGSDSIVGYSSGHKVRMKTGLLKLIAARNLPMVMFRCGLHPMGGKRQLVILQARQFASIQAAANAVAEQLEIALREDSAQWHMWPVARSLLDH